MLKFLVICAWVGMAAAAVRVEYRLSNYRNPGGILATGKKCDRGINKHCDPLITATIDTDTPSDRWPGSKPVNQWTKVFEADEKDSAAVNKIVSKDLCNRGYDRANLRVNVVDVDGDHTTPIEQFECLAGPYVSRSELISEWSEEESCRAKYNPTSTKLMYKWRAFTISDRDCEVPWTGGAPVPVNRDEPRRTWLDRRRY